MDVLLVILFIANLSLGILVFSKAKDKSIKLLFLTIALGVALWNIATFLFWHTPNPLFWGRVMFIGPIVMGSTFLHLCLLFPPQQLPLRSPTKVLMYIPLVGFLFLVPTDIIVKEIIFPSREVIYGIGNALFGLYFFLFVVAGFFILLKKYKSS